jgi:hypothetical protein
LDYPLIIPSLVYFKIKPDSIKKMMTDQKSSRNIQSRQGNPINSFGHIPWRKTSVMANPWAIIFIWPIQ